MTHDHLSDEQLSAHLDGEAADGPGAGTATVEEQMAGCPTCRERFEALSRAQALVRLPVDPVLPSMRATAVASALAEASAPESGPGSTPTGLRGRGGRQPRSPQVWVGAAAAAVLLVVVGVSLGLSHSSNGPAATSAAPRAASPPTTSESSGSSTYSQGNGAPSALGLSRGVADLGSLSSVRVLKASVARALDSHSTSDQATSNPNAAAGTPSNSTAASPGFAAATTVPAAFSTCVMAAQREAGGTGTVELVATATYDHTPALVVVVDVTDPSSTGRLAVVVAQSGCRALARTTV